MGYSVRREIARWLLSLAATMLVTVCCWAQGYDYPYDSFKDRDILRPLVNDRGQILIKEKRALGDFILQGIIYSSGGSKVMINDEVLSEGDSLEGYKIKKIDAYKVILEKDRKEFVLKWEEL